MTGASAPMSLQRRLLVYLLVCAPVVWGLAMVVSVDRARHEVNELFDSEMIRLARQVQVALNPTLPDVAAVPPLAPAGDSGEADVRDLAIVVWDREGRMLMADREGALLPYRPQASGFADVVLNGEAWRAYYLQSFDSRWLVAAGQKAYERDELVFDLTTSQLWPWLLVLPVLLVAMALAVRQALAPVRQLTSELAARGPNDLQPVPTAQAPAELSPLVVAMNALFGRIEEGLARERRFTADAAHELRTPLAVLRAQWDVVRRSGAEAGERERAEAKLSAGLDRMDRLVTQLLALSRLDEPGLLKFDAEVDWPAIVEQAMSDGLALAERRHIELACEWAASAKHGEGSQGDLGHPSGSGAAAGPPPFPLRGDPHLLSVLLRNLLDNAVRYAPLESQVLLRFGSDGFDVENGGPPLNEAALQRLGERFYRLDGQDEVGSGLGVSIARRVAELHGLVLSFSARGDGQGVVASVRRSAPGS